MRRLQTVVSVVAEATGSDTCAVYLYSPEQDTLTVQATVGLNPAAIGAATVPLGVGITGQAARTRQAIATSHAPSHPYFHYDPLLRDEPYLTQSRCRSSSGPTGG